ncbi:MAG: hypothetical protein AAFX62_02175 [Pseudomonadota bacterium]
MVCFCHIPLSHVPASFAKMNLSFTPPTIPLQMNAALALGFGNSMRLDMAIALWMQNLRLPSLKLNGGLMAQLKIALGMFDLFDLPKLQAQLALGVQSLKANALPKLAFLAKLNLAAVLQLAMVARLQLALDALKINLSAWAPTPTMSMRIAPFALKPPQLVMGQMLLGVPIALKFSETLGVPVSRLGSHFRALASIKPPSLGISVQAMMKICMALEAIMTIKAAFGVNALSPAGLSSIAAKLKLYAGLPLPVIPPLNLQAKLDGLPSLPDLKLGAGALPPSGLSLQLPQIPILPTLNLLATLAITLNANFNISPCGPGGCAFG